jgi:hypothetical protein
LSASALQLQIVTMAEPASSRWRAIATILCVVWVSAIAAGMAWMVRFESSPGEPALAPERWPSRAELPLGSAYTLVMSAHPRCPCTRASLAELATVMAESRNRITAHVLFFVPEDASPDWWNTDLWRTAAAIPAVTPLVDRGGTLQRVFGAETSGSVAVYDAAGRLQFNGGLTAARGQQGDNAGRRSLISLIETGEAAGMTPVFGCPLRTPAATNAGLE